ncbi:MAG TPA: hypothetical protein VM791_05305 [Vicinamibacterales bacterium]|nr:hypothetical protein [Vicinamibacterales bacterium]
MLDNVAGTSKPEIVSAIEAAVIQIRLLTLYYPDFNPLKGLRQTKSVPAARSRILVRLLRVDGWCNHTPNAG